MELQSGHWEDELQPADKGPHKLLANFAHGQRIMLSSTWVTPYAAVRGEEACWTGVNLKEYEWPPPR